MTAPASRPTKRAKRTGITLKSNETRLMQACGECRRGFSALNNAVVYFWATFTIRRMFFCRSGAPSSSRNRVNPFDFEAMSPPKTGSPRKTPAKAGVQEVPWISA
ncbi:MAG: hypothetical protein EOP21_09610 [Hyphomicrobiales bacterium]|nr:MAG: hypothetical protein EOP21_09610 [Hyphomicrobiales bacterium]